MTSALAQDTAGDFRALTDQYFANVLFKYAPADATLAGVHECDAQLEDYSGHSIDEHIAALHSYEVRFDAIAPATLDESTQGDLAMVCNQIRSKLLSLETIRGWENNPDSYSSGIANSAFVLMEREYAPAACR